MIKLSTIPEFMILLKIMKNQIMKDVHVHFLHGNPIGYNIDFFEGFIKVAQNARLSEIYLLEKMIYR